MSRLGRLGIGIMLSSLFGMLAIMLDQSVPQMMMSTIFGTFMLGLLCFMVFGNPHWDG